MKKITLLLILLCLSLSINAQITTYPYAEDFESGNGGWIEDNTTNGTWALGTPAATVINSAASGVNSWVTNLTGDYNSGESSSVNSPVFDFSALAAPAISLSIWWESEFSWDGTVLQSSIDGGTTWVNVGANGDPGNWYNDGTIGGNPGGQQEGWTGRNGSGSNGWVTANHALNGLAGEANVILRIAFGADGFANDEGVAFDDISIFDVTCPEPIALVLDSATATTANLSWAVGGSETNWEIVVQTAGTGIPTAAGTPTVNNAPYIAMSLTPVTDYEAYVRADCGSEFSIWLGPLNFTTECATFTPDYIEDFATIPADCWDEADSGDATTGPGDIGAGSWNQDSFLNDGTNNAYSINLWLASKSDWLLSPAFDLTGGPFQAEFDFGVMQFGSATNAGTLGSDDIVQFLISTDLGVTWTVLETWDTTSVFPVAGIHPVYNLTSYAGQTVQFGVLGSEGTVNDTADNEVFVDNFQVRAIPACPDVANLAFVSSTATTANLTWDAFGSETGWEVAVQAPGTGIPTAPGTATTNNAPHVAMGLTPATNYEVYVRAVCAGSLGSWIGPINFATECTTFVAPYTEGFENGGTIPLCWTMDGGEDWDFNLTGPNHVGFEGTITGTTATNMYYAVVDASGTEGPSTLTTPFVDVSTLTTPALSFFEISDNEGNANSQLDVEVWDGAAWNLMGTYNTNAVSWEQKVINISTLTITGDVQARFIFSEIINPNDFYDDIAIDDVTFDELPSCVNPANLVIDSATATTATLSWMVNGTETAWEVAVQAPGTGIPAGAGMAAATNPYVAMGLTPATTYEAYVRANCGTEFSDWIGPLTFTTECTTFVAPYTEGFENGGTIPLCWTMDGGQDWFFDNVTGSNHIGDDGTITGTTATNDYFAWADSSGNNGIRTLFSPFVDVSTLTTPTLSFFEISDNEGNANSQLDVEVWDGAAWNLMGTYNTNTNGWEEIFIDLSGLTITGDVKARFIFSEIVTADFYDDIAIDDVTFDELPSCVFPNTITTANITETSVDISWLPGAGETAWEYLVQPVGTGLPTTMGTPTTTTTVTENGLTAGTSYEIYVISNCTASGDGYSDWTGPFNFTTLPSNDECSTAIVFTANADGSCTNFINGSLDGASQSPQANPCNGTANNDVWFSFTAVSMNHAISLSNIVGSTTFLSHGLYEGTDCNNLTNLTCSLDDESVANGLTVGNTYYIRVFSFNANSVTTTFDLCVLSIPPPITTDLTQYTVPELVEDILVNSPCSTISNITSSTGTDFGSDNGIAYFEANGSGFPFDSGIIMTTGNAANAPGPESGILSDGGSGNWPGDADLENAINTDLDNTPGDDVPAGGTNNASIIEFDFVPFIEDMSFEFIFAAEEYGSFQCGFSDAFAFLLTDTVTGLTTNIAVIPGTTTPVSVFTIRDMAFNGNCSSENQPLFGNYYGPGGLPASTSPTNFLGRTVPLTASSTVVPNRTYHIKLVIADDGDSSYDSAVFLKAGSFEIGEVNLGEDILLTGGSANCEGDEITLDIGVPVGNNATITWYTLNNGIQEPILDDMGIPENGLTLDVTQTNNYIVEIVLNANASCFVIDEILVEFFPNPVFPDTLPDILGCDTDNTGQAFFDITENEALILGTQTDETVTYYETQVDAETGINAITNPATYQSAPPTTIYYRIENNTTGCFKVSTFNLAIAPKPILVQADDILGCDDDDDGISNYDLTSNEDIITNNQSGFIFSYHTNLADADSSANAIVDPSDFDGGAQTIYVRVENANGCFETTTFNLTFGISPMTSFDTGIIYEVCPNATVPISITATADNYSPSEVTISWLNEGVLVSGQTGLTINNVLTAGTYTIQVMFNATGCMSSEAIDVIELPTCIIPQGISPNGDGLNDKFDLSSYDVERLTIFNRNGVKVYEKTNYTDQWFGQSSDGDELPVGTYYYVMDYQGTKNKAAWIYINREKN